MMSEFYSDTFSDALRLGDILTGLITTTPNLPRPITERIENFKIEVNGQKYWANLTPCCSTGENTLMLCPLVQVIRAWFKNPYWANNLLMINDRMKPEESVSPETWKSFTPEEQVKRIQVGPGYALPDYFVYDANRLFEEYAITVGEATTTVCNYIIDFRRIRAIKVDGIGGGTKYPKGIKVLELAPQARKGLRNKVAEFFARVPEEDLPYLAE
jgi:hypothetical protein